MAVNITEIKYGEYGNCIQMENGTIELVITLDVGPRIIRFGFLDGENMFCEAFDQAPTENGWKIYGGHRLWHSPEGMPRSYEPDNKPVRWSVEGDSVTVASAPEKWANFGKEMIVSMVGDGSAVHILHRLTNLGAWTVKCAAWSLTVMSQGGLEVVPTPIEDTGLLANRKLALWPYTRMTDERVWWGDSYITLRQDPNTAEKFKFGINSEDGWAAYFNHGSCFVKNYVVDDEGDYPDGGMSYETFTTDFMLEMESLSPLFEVEPEKTIEHEELWNLYPNITPPENNDKSIDEVMAKMMGGGGCGCGHDHGEGCGHDHSEGCGHDHSEGEGSCCGGSGQHSESCCSK